MGWQGLSFCLHADSIVCLLFFPTQKWEERAVSPATDENQTPNVRRQAAISRSAVFVSTEIEFVVFAGSVCLFWSRETAAFS